jgi:hypothetical protein
LADFGSYVLAILVFAPTRQDPIPGFGRICVSLRSGRKEIHGVGVWVEAYGRRCTLKRASELWENLAWWNGWMKSFEPEWQEWQEWQE